MTSLVGLCRAHSSLDRSDIDHLHRLTAEWAFLADLCFSDLLLHVQSDDGRWMIVDQVRPATNQTMYPIDFVGIWASQADALMNEAASTGEIVEGDITLNVPVTGTEETVARAVAIPVRREGKLIAVLTKEWVLRAGRSLGELERGYALIFDQFTHMIGTGTFPFSGRAADSSAAPRVGDGVMMLDNEAAVTYVSPNANSALHRVGIQANPVGMRLAELGFHDGPARQAFERREPVVEEFEQGADVTLLARCVPLMRGV
ncbi:MAG: histidine kinase N-terminal domain-containing protein, partial [Ilumatobacter sp.]|nr:histidine kinase N-terminal domain-containing protein [Ilumatobacter sp.]